MAYDSPHATKQRKKALREDHGTLKPSELAVLGSFLRVSAAQGKGCPEQALRDSIALKIALKPASRAS